MCVLYLYGSVHPVCVSASGSSFHEIHKIWVMHTTACARLCLCARTRVCITGIRGASTALSHCCAELSPSPGCNSNWLNLPGKLRGWLEAPSNYLTVAKPGVKNRFSCSFRLLFCNKAKFCYQKKRKKKGVHSPGEYLTYVIRCSL